MSLCALLLLLAGGAWARLLMTQQDALALAFPGASIERRTAYLSDEQRRLAAQAGRVKVESRLWTYYVGTSSAGVLGYAYFETHTVRTMPETFMAVVAPNGGLRFVELLAFSEPDDYRPRPRWLEQFFNRRLNERLLLRRSIRNIAGATLTSQALTDGVRRVLAVHAALHQGKER